MRRWFVLACVIGGCWRGEPPAAPAPKDPPPAPAPTSVAQHRAEPGSNEAAMAKMGEFRDKMCACSDKTCADRVTDDMTKWAQEMAKTADKSRKEAKISEAAMKEMQQITEDFTKCITAILAPGQTP